MAGIHDVAAKIVELTGPIPPFSLHRYAYYCQAWHLVWDEEPLFDARIEAWVGGPAIPALYERHQGSFDEIVEWDGDPTQLTDDQKETVEGVVEGYRVLKKQQLGTLVRSEQPWNDARSGLPLGERGNTEIPVDALYEYYLAVETNDISVEIDSIDRN